MTTDNQRNVLKKELSELIFRGEFPKARQLCQGVNQSDLQDLLLELAFDRADIAIYSFVSYLITLQESAELHETAMSLMVNPLCHFEGAYSAGLHHARRGMELEPDKVTWLEMMLYFHMVPDQVVSEEEAHETAKRILSLDPNNEKALAFLSKTAKREAKPQKKKGMWWKKLTYSVLGLLLISGLSTYLYWELAMSREPVVFLIPQGYTGQVEIHYGVPGAGTVLPEEEGKIIVNIPKDGVLKTTSDPEYGFASDEYYYVDEQGNRTKLDEGFIVGRQMSQREDLNADGVKTVYPTKELFTVVNSK